MTLNCPCLANNVQPIDWECKTRKWENDIDPWLTNWYRLTDYVVHVDTEPCWLKFYNTNLPLHFRGHHTLNWSNHSFVQDKNLFTVMKQEVEIIISHYRSKKRFYSLLTQLGVWFSLKRLSFKNVYFKLMNNAAGTDETSYKYVL